MHSSQTARRDKPLQASGVAVQTSPFPLALSTVDGLLRTGSKSTLQKEPQLRDCFTTTPSESGVCMIFDFMCYIHMPPPSNVNTYSEYFNYLWMLINMLIKFYICD